MNRTALRRLERWIRDAEAQGVPLAAIWLDRQTFDLLPQNARQKRSYGAHVGHLKVGGVPIRVLDVLPPS